MKDALLHESVHFTIENASRRTTYHFGKELVVLVNPSKTDVSRMDSGLRDSIVLINGSPLCLGPAINATVKYALMQTIEELERSRGLENSSVLDFSATAGLLSILVSAMGAPQVHLFTDDLRTVGNNLSMNSCPAKMVSKIQLAKMRNLDLVVHDLSFFPSMRLLSQHVTRLRVGGVLAVVGMLGQQVPMLTRFFSPKGLRLQRSDWANEQCFAIFKKTGA